MFYVKACLTIAAILATASISLATTIHVPGDQPTIQAGIDAAVDGDTVLVADGTYAGDGNRDVDFLGKAIVVMSENGPENSIIDCEGTYGDWHRGFYFGNSETSGSVVRGFTIQNGYTDNGGGAIFCQISSPTISNNTFTGNSTYYGGGGAIHCSDSSPTISNNTFTGNSASDWGGAIYCYSYSDPIISNNTFTGNSAVYYGGGAICCYSYPSPTISNNTFTGNSSEEDGGAICCWYASLTISNNTFTENSASDWGGAIFCWYFSLDISNNTFTGNTCGYEGGAIYCYSHRNPTISHNTFTGNSAVLYGGGAIFCWGSSPIIKNCILWGDIPDEIVGSAIVTYSDAQGGWPGEGNIDADPLFLDSEHHLHVDSPCIDSGDPESEIPPNGGDRVDMGALEYQYPEFSFLTLTFDNTPLMGESGETVVWDFTVANSYTDYVAFDGWVAISGPANSIRDSILGVTIPPSSVISGNVRLRIPMRAPLGSYTAKGRVGIMHAEIWDGEVFNGVVVESNPRKIEKEDRDNWIMKIELLGSNPIPWQSNRLLNGRP